MKKDFMYKKINYVFIAFISFILVGIVLINKFCYIRTSNLFTGVVSDNNTISLIVPIEQLNIFTDNKKLYLDNKEYKFVLKRISENNILEAKNYYKEVIIEVNLEGKDNYLNNIKTVHIKKEEKSLLLIIKKFIREEIYGQFNK